MPQVRIELGLRPLVLATIDTGPQIILTIQRGPKLSALGEINLGSIVSGREIKGEVWIDAQVSFKSWNDPPSQGTINLKSIDSLTLNNSTDIEGLSLKAMLNDNRLEISELKAGKPLDFTCSGHCLINWSSLDKSTYQVQGIFKLSGKNNSFEQAGRIAELIQ